MSTEIGSGNGSGKRSRTVLPLVALVFAMVGLSFAAVPLYDLFCRVTGYGGTTQRAEASSGEILDRTVTIRFDSTIAASLPWSVEPEQKTITLKIGETAEMIYVAQSGSDLATVGTSTYNVSPPSAGLYFNKMECFCFTEQPLGPGDSADMPVVFFVDPEFARDKDTQSVSVITLSYAFYPVEQDVAEGAPKPLAAAAEAPNAEAGRQPL